MRSFVKWNLVVLAVAMSLACATGAYADTLSWIITGTDATGSGTMTIDTSTTYTSQDTGNGGYYLVTDMSGNIYIDGTGGAISNLFSDPTVLPGIQGIAPGLFGNLAYDNLVDPFHSPYLDSYGVVFNVDGFDYRFELCGPSSCYMGYTNGNTTPGLLAVDDNGFFDFYPVDFSVEATAVPEPSVLALLTLGLIG
jgi:hypothetical protein